MNLKQIKGLLLDLETKYDKNHNLYYRLSLFGIPATYFYVFANNSLPADILLRLKSPHNLVNRLVVITYQEFPNRDNPGVFNKVKNLQII
jgi:hypothetical protein